MRFLCLCACLAAFALGGCGSSSSTTHRTESRVSERTVESGTVLKGDR